MGEVAVIPGWVVVPAVQVADCHRIAQVIATRNGGYGLAAPVAATINWVTGGQASPMSAMDGEPSAAVARAEMMLADGPVPAEAWRTLDVAPRTAVTDDRGWCEAVAATLGWLLGIHPRPPIRLPRRNPDGTTPPTDQLYREAIEARPYGGWTPPEREAAWHTAAVEAVRYRRLADLADSAG